MDHRVKPGGDEGKGMLRNCPLTLFVQDPYHP
jgi:hypothetical protein